MNTNKISATLADTDKANVLGMLGSITSTMSFMQGLTIEQRKSLNKAANGRLPFIQMAYLYAQQNPTVLSGKFNIPEFGKDVTLITALQPVVAAEASLHEKLTDTYMLVNSDAYDQALDVYDSYKRANRNGEYDAIVDALGVFFKQAPAPAAAPAVVAH